MNSLTQQNRSTRWKLVLPALLVPFLASFLYFIWFPGTIFSKSCYVGVKFFTLLWPLVAVLFLLKERFSDDPRPKKHWEGIILGGIFGLLTFGLMYVMYRMTPIGDMIRENGDLIVGKIDEMGIREHFVLFAIFISFLHSALEEFFWRLFGYGQLRKLVSVGMAVLIAAITFALHHIVVLSEYVAIVPAILFGACVGLGGAVWSLIFQRTNSLWGAWFSHMIIDLAIMWIGWDLLKLSEATNKSVALPL